MIHLRTQNGSSTAKDPSSFLWGVRLMDSPVHPRSPCRLWVSSSVHHQSLFTVTTTQDRWALHSSQDGDVLANSSTCHNVVHIRATRSKPSASMTQSNPGPSTAKGTWESTSSTHQRKQTWQGFLRWSNNHHIIMTPKHASSYYLPPSYCLPAQHRSLQWMTTTVGWKL